MSRRIIGLTGGIATGKTTVSHYLSQTYHIPIIDADLLAKQAVEIGSPILDEIRLRYGNNILFPDGTLNRKKLGEIIFNNPAEKIWLENQIHPYVRNRIQAKLKELNEQAIVLVIPLLFEAKMTDLVSEIWVVYCSPEEQIRRLMKRDQLTQEQAIKRIQNQWSIEEKKALADVILENSRPEQLFKQIDQVFS
ncbi:dephospho-CoA kinase [Aphanothece hegewaldii CCALA 016]|uniref:Dephospho-CoA kinase n=1 Tax=Aphanothece hegewaldii CCALA 016 TaxID=2107694 RepID=A0A2T1LVJ2_9CHRO|nr:dephospho-CoA kinase [Aphanothece hegewaldii]PSF35737.1 dephospho-CoA kinase [Aphanothece hegewaldii CCALA 016]